MKLYNILSQYYILFGAFKPESIAILYDFMETKHNFYYSSSNRTEAASPVDSLCIPYVIKSLIAVKIILEEEDMKSKKTHRIKLYIIVAAIFLVVIIVCIYPKEGAAPKLGGTNAEVASGSAAVQEPETGKELFAENPEQGLTQKKTIGFYADAPDSYYQLINDAFTALAQQDPDLDWDIEYKV
ncbi:MAG: hypothetical protein LBG50_02675, partial [Clostridiales Family XIII bacterium]|nr:hypothetical protein [Clostridiales Family XIII bacterium]